MGQGIGKGVETAALGATDGVLTAGAGLASGVERIGKGIGGAFLGGVKETSSTPQQMRREQQLEQEDHQPWRPGDRIRARRERRRHNSQQR